MDLERFLLTWGVSSVLFFIFLTLLKQWIKRIVKNELDKHSHENR
jgi:hypothetical protein